MSQFTTRQAFAFRKTTKVMKNRTVLAPLTHNMSFDNGDLSDAEIAWLKKCATGGFGMIITAATSVSLCGRSWQGQPALVNEKQQDSFAEIARNAKKADALAIVQLHHGGMRTESKYSTGNPVSPSCYSLDEHYPKGVREIASAEIELLINAFVDSSKRAYFAKMDGVEIHAAFNFLLSNFSNPKLNKRKDLWGGSFENRNRIIFEIVKRVRAEVPRDFIVGVRLSPENYGHFSGIDIEEQLHLSNALQTLDIDYIHMSLYDSFKKPNHMPESERSLLQWIKANLAPEVTLIIAGNISDVSSADKVVSQGADLVAIGKAAVGNPDWVNRINSGKALVQAPYTYEHLTEIGFTAPAISYMSGISGLVEQEPARAKVG